MTVGDETYARYYYLWHLVAIGALKVDAPADPELCPRVTAAIWDHVPHRTPYDPDIALIDMGVARFHPNLDGPTGAEDRVLWDKAVDFASHPFGARTVAPPAAANRHLEAPETFLVDGDLNHYSAGLQAELRTLRLFRIDGGVKRYVSAYDRHYSTHGTACAGLTSGTTFGSALAPEGRAIAYYGVDPFSRVVPIATSISPDPLQLIRAFLYARKVKPGVILFPRSAHELDKDGEGDESAEDEDDTVTTGPTGAGGGTKAPNETKRRWEILAKLILEISKEIPIVCAAGNDGRSSLIYPASLAGGANNGVIAVGAVSYAGLRSGYSNYGPGLSVVAPSDDGEVYTRYQVRLDRRSADAADFFVPPAVKQTPFSPERLITLDVPGPRGYREGTRQGPVRSRDAALDDPSGLYSAFGGTSGAAAIVAGVVSLMQRNSPTRRTGVDIKNRLEAHDPKHYKIDHWYWKTGRLKRDRMNKKQAPTDVELFGKGGLVNVQRLLGITL